MGPAIFIIYGLIYIPFFAIAFVIFIFIIKLMRRGITALDEYIDANTLENKCSL